VLLSEPGIAAWAYLADLEHHARPGCGGSAGTQRESVNCAKARLQARLAVRSGQKLSAQTAWPAIDAELICRGREVSDQDVRLRKHGRIVSRSGTDAMSVCVAVHIAGLTGFISAGGADGRCERHA